MSQYLQNKKGKVQSVFNKVYDKYDLMNDFMSIGIHRLWKKDMINWMAPFPKKKLIDMACGTGDVGKIFLENTNYEGEVLFVGDSDLFVTDFRYSLAPTGNVREQEIRRTRQRIVRSFFMIFIFSWGCILS